ncbi:protein-tyrosine phosphatase-like protein [Paraphysoderma sedebokerense]|nr:protein-tyrosine phosphatase-like protein [Paraphysoderma sedebokerense]
MALLTERIVPRSYLSRSFCLIEYRHLRFLICDSPTENSLPQILLEFKRYGVTDVVRACEPTYSTLPLNRVDINVHELSFKDGGVPSQQIIQKFLAIVESRFDYPASPSSMDSSSDDDSPKPTIAVHCIAGLGRAPVLVAIALITYGMSPLDAIEYIRSRRRGAFNSRQIQFIDSYKKQKRSSLTLSGASLRQTLGRVFRLKKIEVN